MDRIASRSRRTLIGACSALLFIWPACSESVDDVEADQRQVTRADQAVADASASVDQAGADFCTEAQDYIAAIDRYGKIFGDSAATVGDVRTLGADLADPRDSTTAAAQAVLDAHNDLNEANQELADARSALAKAKAEASGKKKKKEPSPAPVSSPNVSQPSVDRVKLAESELEAASEGISDQTPIVEAAESFTAAAFALEVAWLNLFIDAGCLTDEQSSQAAAALSQYTVALQTDLKGAGYFKDGATDGVYGPKTVAAVEDLQADAGLPVTGYVDRATRDALDEALAQEGLSAASQAQVQTTSIQTVLSLAGYWSAPIDGEWTPELEAALKEFQKDLGVEQTGAVDAATLAALEESLVEIQEPAEPLPSPIEEEED